MEQSTRLGADNRFSIVPHWVIFSGASSGAVHLYAVLAKYADNDTLQAFPSRATLAKDTGWSVRSIDKHIAELEKVGALKVERRIVPETGQNRSNMYTVVTAKPQQKEGGAEFAPPGAGNGTLTNTHLTTPNSFTSEQSSDPMLHVHSPSAPANNSPANSLNHEQRALARAHIIRIAHHIQNGDSFWDDEPQDIWADLITHLELSLADQDWPDFDLLCSWTISGTPSTNYAAGVELNKILHHLNQ